MRRRPRSFPARSEAAATRSQHPVGRPWVRTVCVALGLCAGNGSAAQTLPSRTGAPPTSRATATATPATRVAPPIVVRIDGRAVSSAVTVKPNRRIPLRVTTAVGARDSTIRSTRSLAPEIVRVVGNGMLLETRRPGTATLVVSVGAVQRRVRVTVEATASGAAADVLPPETPAPAVVPAAPMALTANAVEARVGTWIAEFNARPAEFAMVVAPDDAELAKLLRQEGLQFAKRGGFALNAVLQTSPTGGRVVVSFPVPGRFGRTGFAQLALDVTVAGREVMAATMVAGSLARQ